jgi:hypothetical protein
VKTLDRTKSGGSTMGRGVPAVRVAAATAAAAVLTLMTPASAGAQEKLTCETRYPNSSTMEMTCSFPGQHAVRGFAHFAANSEPELLEVWDEYRDGKGVTVYVRGSDGKSFGKLRDASGSSGTHGHVYVPEGRIYYLQMCLDGGICGRGDTGKA